MGKFRLGSVLRARQAQEDLAKGAVMAARAAAFAADGVVHDRGRALATRRQPQSGTGLTVVAALSAGHSLAVSLGAAVRSREAAEEVSVERYAELAEAAKRRRMVEKLAERHAVARQKLLLATDQKNIDELSISARSRANAQGMKA